MKLGGSASASQAVAVTGGPASRGPRSAETRWDATPGGTPLLVGRFDRAHRTGARLPLATLLGTQDDAHGDVDALRGRRTRGCGTYALLCLVSIESDPPGTL